MPNLIEIISICIAMFSAIMTFVNFKDKKSDKATVDLEARIKATLLADQVTLKAGILQDAQNIKAVEIKELQNKANECDVREKILEERVNNLKELSEKIDEKLDKIMLIMMNGDDDDSK